MWSVAVEKSPITAPLTGAADAPDAAASPMPAAAILATVRIVISPSIITAPNAVLLMHSFFESSSSLDAVVYPHTESLTIPSTADCDSHRREWIYPTSELRCSLNASQAVSRPSHLTCTVVGVAKSQMNLLFNLST